MLRLSKHVLSLVEGYRAGGVVLPPLPQYQTERETPGLGRMVFFYPLSLEGPKGEGD